MYVANTKLNQSCRAYGAGMHPFRFAMVIAAVLLASCTDTPTEIPARYGPAPSLVRVSLAVTKFDAFAAKVDALVGSGVLTAGQGNALIAKVEKATQMAERGQALAALGVLNALILQVDGLIAAGWIPSAEGEQIVDLASTAVNGAVLVGSWTATSILVDGVEVLAGTSFSFSATLNDDGTFSDAVSGDVDGLFCEGSTMCADTGTYAATATTISICDPGCDEAQYSLLGDEFRLVFVDPDAHVTVTMTLVRNSA